MEEYKDFKIVFPPAFGLGSPDNEKFVREYDTLLEATTALNALVDYTLLLHEHSLMPDYTNMGMIYRNDGVEWIEIDDEGVKI